MDSIIKKNALSTQSSAKFTNDKRADDYYAGINVGMNVGAGQTLAGGMISNNNNSQSITSALPPALNSSLMNKGAAVA
jgi:fructose-1-phosphate kinase PfkB-like protein